MVSSVFISVSVTEACNIEKGCYRYTEDLWSLHYTGDSPWHPSPSIRPPERQGQLHPMEAWQPFLDSHPDKQFDCYVGLGLTEGFWIGFDRSLLLKPSRGNQQSVNNDPEVVTEYLNAEIKAGRLNGPFQPHLPGVHCSPIGIIPKPNQVSGG